MLVLVLMVLGLLVPSLMVLKLMELERVCRGCIARNFRNLLGFHKHNCQKLSLITYFETICFSFEAHSKTETKFYKTRIMSSHKGGFTVFSKQNRATIQKLNKEVFR